MTVQSVTLQCPECKLIYVKYKDHVFFKNIKNPIAKAVVREAVGWVKNESNDALLLECDRAVLKQSKSVNGVIILKSCILEFFELSLNSSNGKDKRRVCAFSQRSEKLSPKQGREGQK